MQFGCGQAGPDGLNIGLGRLLTAQRYVMLHDEIKG
jgi:hypothetical protein